MMERKLVPGLSAEVTHRVEKNFLASEIGSGMVNVFSTAMMIAFMEEAAVAAVQPYLEEGYTTVGAHLDITHSAPTPLGMEIRCQAVLKEVSPSGKKLTFDVSATDASGLIGGGKHWRVLVHKDSFESSAAKKLKP